jgi:hypothetical protein
LALISKKLDIAMIEDTNYAKIIAYSPLYLLSARAIANE